MITPLNKLRIILKEYLEYHEKGMALCDLGDIYLIKTGKTIQEKERYVFIIWIIC